MHSIILSFIRISRGLWKWNRYVISSLISCYTITFIQNARKLWSFFSYFIPRKQSSTNLILLQKQTVIEPRDKTKYLNVGFRAVVEVLLAAGVDVNTRTSAGTAMHEAALCGKMEVVRALLDRGVDLGIRDSRQNTVLDLLGQFPPHVTQDITAVIKSAYPLRRWFFFLPSRRDIPSKRAVQLTRHVSGEKKSAFSCRCQSLPTSRQR